MQYKIQQGAVDKSYGIYIAEILNFPEQIISDSKKKLEELEGFEIEEKSVVEQKYELLEHFELDNENQ